MISVIGSNSGGGVSQLSALTDVNLSAVTNDQELKYNATTSKWVNYTPTAVNIGNFTFSNAGVISTPQGSFLTHQNDGGSNPFIRLDADYLQFYRDGVKRVEFNPDASSSIISLSGLDNKIISDGLLRLTSPAGKGVLVQSSEGIGFMPSGGGDYYGYFRPESSFFRNILASSPSTESFNIFVQNTVKALTVFTNGEVNIPLLKQGKISGLTDVFLSSLSNNQELKYDSGLAKWVNHTPPVVPSIGNWVFTGNDAGIATDLDLIGLSNNLVTVKGDQVLFGDGSISNLIGTNNLFIKSQNAGGQIAIMLGNTLNTTAFKIQHPGGDLFAFRGDGSVDGITLPKLDDVNITGLSNNQQLKYDSVTSKWINFTPSAGTTGNWLFSGDNAGIAGSANLITLANTGVGLNDISGNELFSARGYGGVHMRRLGAVVPEVTNMISRGIFSANALAMVENPIKIASDPFNLEVVASGVPSNISGLIYVVADRVYFAGGQTPQNLLIYSAHIDTPWNLVSTGGACPNIDGATAYYGNSGLYFYGCGPSFDQIWYCNYSSPTVWVQLATMTNPARLNRIIKSQQGDVIYGGTPSGSTAQLIDPTDPTKLTNIATIPNSSNYGACRFDSKNLLFRAGNLYEIPENNIATQNLITNIPALNGADRPSMIGINDYLYIFSQVANFWCIRAHKSDLTTWTASTTVMTNLYDPELLIVGDYLYVMDTSVANGNVYRSRVGGTTSRKGNVLTSIQAPGITNSSGITYTTDQIQRGLIYRQGLVGITTDVLPTAQNIVRAFGATVGTSLFLEIVNSSAFTLNIVQNTGGNYIGANNIPANNTMRGCLRITDVGSGTEAYDFIVIHRVPL